MTFRQDISRALDLGPMLQLFSVVMVFNRDLEIEFASDTVTRFIPFMADKPTLFEVFEVARPASVKNFDEIEFHGNTLFLLTAVDNRFAVRGQVVNGSNNTGDFLIFCGAPWMAWMMSNQPDIKLGLRDFAPQDAQIDQLFYMETEHRMVADLEQLNVQLQEAQAKLEASERARSAFFAQMSHEMRTPLNGLVSALSLMKEQKPEGQMAKLLDLAGKSSQNLMQVINYVLDLSKLEAADIEQTEESFDLTEVINSVTDVVQARAMEKNLALHSHVAGGLPHTYFGDSSRLRQVLLNLVINAIKFTDSGEVSITADSANRYGQTVRIEVTDTGVGIPREFHAGIFKPFSTAEHSGQQRLFEGTGLGLDIVRRNVEGMGGRVGLASSPGVGSTFWVELPFRVGDPVESPGLASLDKAREQSGLSGTVLLVDDNATNLMLASMILEGMGVRVLQASSGEVAVATALGEQIDLVLMDISMPGMDGHEATRLIRKERSPAALPVVALTAYASSEERAKSEASGMNGYLTKPVGRETLAQELSRWLVTKHGDGEAPERVGFTKEDHLEMPVIESMLQQIGRDNLITVINKFCIEAVDRWQALEKTASSADLAREAHTLASTCRSFGLLLIADRLQAVEAAAKVGITPDGVEDLPAIGSTLKQGLEVLQSRVRALLH